VTVFEDYKVGVPLCAYQSTPQGVIVGPLFGCFPTFNKLIICTCFSVQLQRKSKYAHIPPPPQKKKKKKKKKKKRKQRVNMLH
jgi:hypothetical protein